MALAALTCWPAPGSSARSISRLPRQPAGAAQQLRAFHHEGQTFLVWKESVQLITSAAPTIADYLAAQAVVSGRDGARNLVRYRVYRSAGPLLPANLASAEPVAEVKPLSAFNTSVWGANWDQTEKAARSAPTFVVTDGGAPLLVDDGLHVVMVKTAARRYYAVAMTLNGVVQPDTFQASGPVDEAPAPASAPVLQSRKQGPLLYGQGEISHYVRWIGPPETNLASLGTNWVVAVPASPRWPAPLQIGLHSWGSTAWDGYAWWYGWKEGTVLLATNDYPPQTWWFGYHENYGLRPARGGDTVHNYTERRILSMLTWVQSRYRIDPNRVFVAGVSMGGSGASALATRHPSIFAFGISWVGIHDFGNSPQFTSGFANLLGAPALKLRTDDGELVWNRLNLPRVLRQDPGAETAFLTFANGKNDSGIGWAQAVDFVRALQATRRPFLFTWGQGGHGERAYVPTKAGGGDNASPILDIRRDRSLPAFTRGSLDNDPGNGDPAAGDPSGQINLFPRWEADSIVDLPDRYELTLYLVRDAPRDSCSADVTLRRVQAFKPPPGAKVAWSNIDGGKSIQSGSAEVDSHGLVTLPEVQIRKGRSRIVLSRAAPQ